MSDNETQPEVLGMQVKKTRNKSVPKKAAKPAGKAEPVNEAAPAVKKVAKKKAVETAEVIVDSSEPKKTARKAPVAVPLFQAPPTAPAKSASKTAAKKATDKPEKTDDKPVKAAGKNGRGPKADAEVAEDAPKKRAPKKGTTDESVDESADSGEESSSNSRNRNRNRNRNKNRDRSNSQSETDEASTDSDSDSEDGDSSGANHKRSRKRNRDGSGEESGSIRVDAKRQRRRDGRDAGRRRAPIVTEAEFLARRENVDRVMVVRQQGSRTQIAVLEDGVLVEHYINQSTSGSLVGNVYVGRVQNVLPGMEAAFVDIGKGRNAVLYAGEVNWDAAGLEGQSKRIESALKTGDTVLVQVTKDPVGQKGARLTSQISLPGRFVVYVPNHPMTGISRKLPERERTRLKNILREV
ncbi:MAG: ribonuclease E/G, partial [Actinobacteria bacterium]|nr:ribonuclease E/G [Actinomycetota bacterium]